MFLSCSVKLLVKYDFILGYEALVNAIRASSSVESVPQISAKPIVFQRNLLGKLPRNRPFFTNHFSAKLASKFPRNSREIGHFFREFVPENPAKFDFFPRPTRSPAICTGFLLPAVQLKVNETTVKQRITIIIAYPLAFKEGVQRYTPKTHVGKDPEHFRSRAST